MNRKQLIIMWVGIAVFVLMAFLPPWCAQQQLTYKEAKFLAAALGEDLVPDDPVIYPKYWTDIQYTFILNRPAKITYSEPDPLTGKTFDVYKVNRLLLVLQLAAVAGITYLLADPYKNKGGIWQRLRHNR